MRSSIPLLVVVALVLLTPFASAVPAKEVPLPPDAGAPDAPWWATWPGDEDGDGVHDHLEALAASSALEDPSARVELVVDMDRRPGQEDLAALVGLGMDVVYVSSSIDAVLGTLPATRLDDAAALPGVVMLEAQGTGELFLESAVPSISVNRVWEGLGAKGRGVTIAVLDTGIRATHQSLDDLDDLASTDDPKVVAFFDAYSNSTREPYDAGEHGTWVSGIAAGTGAPGGRNVGVAPQARLVGVRIGSSGGIPESTALQGIDWVIENRETYNISVMSCSWGIVIGGPNDHNGNSAISRAADRAVAEGINVVVASGNTALSATVSAPGDAADVITVGSVDDDHVLSSFSSEGPTTDGRTKPDVCAPGEDITGPWSRGDGLWYTGDGTSASAPLVSGLVALMLEANPYLTPEQVKQILHETSEHNTALSAKYFRTPNNGYGWGVVHATGAVRRAWNLLPPDIDVPVNVESGEELDVEVQGTMTRTVFTTRGEDGRSFLGEDEYVLEASIPADWDRPTMVTSELVGDLRATPVQEPVTEDGGFWRLRTTFRVRDTVDSTTTANPTISFRTAAPVSAEGSSFSLLTRATLNNMEGEQGRKRVAVGGNVPPEVVMVDPGVGSYVADEQFVIRWRDDDPDDDARISLYSDTDQDPSDGRVLIASGIREDPEGEGDTYVWDTSTLLAGDVYYIQAVIDDGKNEPFSVYGEGAITIKHSGNSPPFVEVLEPDGEDDEADMTFEISYVARDPDDTASVSLYWDSDDLGYDGIPIVLDLVEEDGFGTYAWDTSGRPDGASLWVYAIVYDGNNPQTRAYGDGPVTIRHVSGPTAEDWSPTGANTALDTPVRVAFDREMDTASVEAALSVSPARAGTFDWIGNTMRYTPSAGWSPATGYQVTLAQTARDVEGRTLLSELVFYFTTVEDQQPSGPLSVAIDGPTEGEVVSGDVWVEGTSENLGSGGEVEVRVDGGEWRQASGNEGWSWLWFTTDYLDGPHTVFARGTSSDGRTSPLAMANVTVRNTQNSPPAIAPVGDVTAHEGEALVLEVKASDDDGDALIFSDDTALFDIDPVTGVIDFTPAEGQEGTWTVTVAVYDGTDRTEVTFNLTVVEADDGGDALGPLWDLLVGIAPYLLVVLVVLALAGLAARRSRRSRGDRKGAGDGGKGVRA